MKTLCAYIMVLLALTGSIAAADSSTTFRFDQADLRLDVDHGKVGYVGLDLMAIAPGLSLPYLSCVVELTDAMESVDLSYPADSCSSLGFVNPALLNDIPTTDTADEYPIPGAFPSYHQLGLEPAVIADITTAGTRRFARLLVFPVTVDITGQLTFHHEISLCLNGVWLDSTRILTEDKAESVADKFNQIEAMASTTGFEYVIVTSTALMESFEVLARYKNATGIPSEVIDIDSILPYFSGRDDAEKLREYLKQFYAQDGRYVLLAGDETLLPIRYTYASVTYGDPSLEDLLICDLYFADLTGDWNADNDNVWGEKYTDAPDLTPELCVGRLPFNTVDEASNYVAKLIAYETNPGGGDPAYLNKAFFFSSDQMRDWDNGGQHRIIASAYPETFAIDTVNGVELSRGDDLNPYNLAASALPDIISQGYGIVNVIAHGRTDAFGVRTTGYNEWPKSYMITNADLTVHGDVHLLTPNGKTSFYYSLACENGGFDMDQPPFNQTNPNLAQTLLGLKDAGAVGFIGYSRWGWVSSSYLFQAAFFDSLFAYPERPAVEALYDAKAAYYYYRDQVYGLNYFGDPTLRIYASVPQMLELATSSDQNALTVTISSNGSAVDQCLILLSLDGQILTTAMTDNYGTAEFIYDFVLNEHYTLAALKEGCAVLLSDYTLGLSTDVDDRDESVPAQFELCQNYPNPFNPTTTIRFQLAKSSPVTLTVYNVLGQVVDVLLDGTLPTGIYDVAWNGCDSRGNDAATGVYFYGLNTGEFQDRKKMLLLR